MKITIDTPRTKAAQARCGFADMAIMEKELKIVTDALKGMMKEFDDADRILDPDLSVDRPRIAARAALEMLNAPSPFKS